MRTTILLELISSLAVVTAFSVPEWHPQGDGEVRGPCPGLNVLANHGILPRSGRNMDHDTIVTMLHKWYNISSDISSDLFEKAINQSGRPGATTFDMIDLRIHHNASVIAIEGDASFSRADYYWGNNYSLNQTVWSQTRSYWQGETIDVQEFGNAARARYLTSKETNPTFYFPEVGQIGAAMAFMTNVLGDAQAGTVPTAFVDSWIVKEKLPTGWQTSSRAVNGSTVTDLATRIFIASRLNAMDGKGSKRNSLVHKTTFH